MSEKKSLSTQPDPHPKPVNSNEEGQDSLDGALEDLREAIVLCEWEERSVAEAAAILETTPKAIESRLYRARHILRDRLKDWFSQS